MDYNFLGLNSYQVNSIRSQASLLKHQQDVKSYISSILNLLFSEIDKIPEVKGAGVCYVNGNGEITEFRTAEPRSNKQPIYIVLREPPESLTQSHFASYLKQAQEKPKESRLAQELSDLFFSCTPVILGWFVVGASAAAMPLTGGLSGVVAVASYTATVSGAILCANSLVRTGAAAMDKDDALEYLDHQDWYNGAKDTLEATALIGGTAALSKNMYKHSKLMKSPDISYKRILKGLSRPERARGTRSAIHAKYPKASNAEVKNLIKSGAYPRRFNNDVFRAECIVKIKDAVSTALAVTGSAKSGVLNVNHNWSWVNSLAIGVMVGDE
ncbi:hypothetical protein ACPUEK_05335 [Marinomonas gallaica]|uniref:hypothetical protein n=1 Tax=Marinomonas gallaica TaxID=1806667 RepID=UPI003CE49657